MNIFVGGGWLSLMLFVFVWMQSAAFAAEWHIRKAPVSEHLYSVAYGEGIYVAVGNHRTILTSTDGVRWRLRRGNAQGWLWNVAYGKGVFVAVGNAYQTLYPWGPLASPSPYGPPDSPGYSTNENARPIMVSPDGLSWKGLQPGLPSLTEVIFAKGHFVAVGRDVLCVSPDGYTWSRATNRFNPLNHQISAINSVDIAYGNGAFVLTTDEGWVLRSTNAVDWTRFSMQWGASPLRSRSYTGPENPVMIHFFGRRFLGSAYDWDGESYEPRFALSKSGVEWSEINGPSFVVVALARSNRRIVAVGGDGENKHWIQSSANELDWSSPPTEIGRGACDVAHGKNGFVVVGMQGLILQSTTRQ